MNSTFKTSIALCAILFIIFFRSGAALGQVTSNGTSSEIQIKDFQVDRTIVGAGKTATASLTLENQANYRVTIGAGINIPDNLEGSVVVNGGDSNLVLMPHESKKMVLSIKNTGNLGQDTTATFTFSASGYSPGSQPLTQQFQLTFILGLGPSTLLTIRAIDGSTQQPLGLNVKCVYGVNDEDSKIDSTRNDGTVTFDLGTFTGQVKVTAYRQGQYQNQTQTITVGEGANSATFYLAPELSVAVESQNNQEQWIPYGIAFGFVAIIISVTGYLARKKHQLKKRGFEVPISIRCFNSSFLL